MKMSLVISMSMCIAAASGCISQPHPGFRPGEESRLSIVQAVESLLTDPRFKENYAVALANAKRSGKIRPSVTIMPIENNADNRGDVATRQMYRRLQSAIRKTGRFEIIDPSRRMDMTEVETKGPDQGESGERVQDFGNYVSADFVLHGELVKEETGSRSLNIDMLDTRTGLIFWDEVVTPSDSLTR